jgi:hypothetical protein
VHEHLVQLLREADAAGDAARRDRGRAARAAAERLSWDAVADMYAERIAVLTGRQGALAGVGAGRQVERFPLPEAVSLRVLATPAWRGQDRLGELLAAWSDVTSPDTSACLYLLADPEVDGDPAALEAVVMRAAQTRGADLEDCADINVLMEPFRPDRDLRLHATVDAYIPLHGACAGHVRFAERAGNAVVMPDAGAVAGLLATTAAAATLGVADPATAPA